MILGWLLGSGKSKAAVRKQRGQKKRRKAARIQRRTRRK